MAKIETVKIPAGNEAGYVIVNKEDVGTDVVAKWQNGAPVAAETESSDEGEASGFDRKALEKKRKAELVAIAEEKGIEVVPDDMTNAQIIDAILGAESAE